MYVENTLGRENAIIGMVHLDPLPGSPRGNPIEHTIDTAKRDVTRLKGGGVDGLMIENFGDAPFYSDTVPKHVVAAMTRIVTELQSTTSLPMGVNVLRNDAQGAISVAAATGIEFIRVNVHVGARVTDQGIIEGTAHETLRLRDKLGTETAILADVDVKHSVPVTEFSLHEQISNVITRGLADGVIVSGAGTGDPVDGDLLTRVETILGDINPEVPLIVGSGVSSDTVPEVFEHADAAIIGSALKQNGDPTKPVSADRVRQVTDQRE